MKEEEEEKEEEEVKKEKVEEEEEEEGTWQMGRIEEVANFNLKTTRWCWGAPIFH